MKAKKFEKKAVFEHLADSIEAQIRQEGWSGLLPSGRDLAGQHNVSLPTVQKAIALLLERGVLISRGGKRRLQVATGVSGSGRRTDRFEVLVLTTDPLIAYDASISMGVMQLGESLKAKGDGFRFVDLSHVQGVERRKAAHAEMVKSRPTHVILMKPDKPLFAGVARHPAKLATMFGNIRSKRIMTLGVRYGYLVEIALQHLMPLGHRHFLMPFFGRKIKMRESMAAIARISEEKKVRIDVRLTSQPLTTENLGRFLGPGLAGGATAVLFPQWTDFMPSIAYFASKRLEFPRDLSVVALIGNATSRMYTPPIACCLSSPDGIAQQAEIWVRSEKVEDASYISVYQRTWESGGSIGPVKSKG
jgi:DNA-binding transcriptional regulator YhcF (GntR family)/DNA-binding LacI/PurR family transcriptional regulator